MRQCVFTHACVNVYIHVYQHLLIFIDAAELEGCVWWTDCMVLLASSSLMVHGCDATAVGFNK